MYGVKYREKRKKKKVKTIWCPHWGYKLKFKGKLVNYESSGANWLKLKFKVEISQL